MAKVQKKPNPHINKSCKNIMGMHSVSRILFLCVLCGSSLVAYAADTLHLNLQECIRRAKEQSPAARVVRYSYQSSQHNYNAAVADYYPQISLALNAPGYTRSIVPVLQPNGSYQNVPQEQSYSEATLNLSQKIPFSGGDITFSSGVNNRRILSESNQDIWQSFPFLVQLRQPIWGFNNYSYARQNDQLRFDAATRTYIEQMEDIAIDAAGKFFDLYIAMMNVNNALFNKSINDSIYILAKGRYNVGKIAENDLLQNELALLNAGTEVERAVLEEQRTRAALHLLLDVNEQTVIDIQPPASAPALTVDPKAAVRYALMYRSDVKEIEIQHNNAERTLEQNKAASRPATVLTASYGLNQTAPAFSGVYKDVRDREWLSVGLEIPLLSWGKNSELVESATAELKRTELQSGIQRRQLEQEVYFQVRDFLQLQQQLTIAEKGEQIAARGYDIAKNRYIIGKIETTELMLAQQRKDDARRSYFQTLRNYWTSYYRLRRITLFDFVTNKPLLSE